MKNEGEAVISSADSKPKDDGERSIWRVPVSMEALGVFFWLLKDMGWCLLMGCVCFPAAALAIIIESKVLCGRWHEISMAVRIHSVVLLMWLVGNAIWMTGELSLSPSPEIGRHFPWYSGPYLGAQPEAYDKFVHACQAVLLAAVAMLLTFYAVEVYHLMIKKEDETSPVEVEDKLIFGWFTPNVYSIMFVGPWIVKDLFWTIDLLWGGLFFGLIVLALVVDCYRRFRTVEFVAEICWVVGNTVWICAEDFFGDAEHWPRWTAGTALFCGVLITLYAMMQSSDDGEKRKLVTGKTPEYGG